MELNYDWRVFQSFFQKKKSLQNELAPIFVVTYQGILIDLLSEDTSFYQWQGSLLDELKATYPQRKIIEFDRQQIDKTIYCAVRLPHYYDQTLSIVRSHNFTDLFENHFFLDLFQSFWKKFWPVTFGLMVMLDDQEEKCIFLVLQKGKIISFQKPDFSYLDLSKRKNREEKIRFLSERYFISVQGLFLHEKEWSDWSLSHDPWKKILKSMRKDRNQCVPFRWHLLFLVAFKAWFGHLSWFSKKNETSKSREKCSIKN